jgi:predicted DNA binding CopG/RHH family protein
MNDTKPKAIPHFSSDEELEHFVETADLSEYDLSDFRPMRFELRKKDARINMRVPAPQLDAIKQAAANEGIPYQRFIRNAIDRALADAGRRKAGS